MVLVIDDDTAVAPLIRELLRAGGEVNLDVVGAAPLGSAFARLGDPALKAVVLRVPADTHPGNATALEALRAVRASVPASVAVIALVPDGDHERALACLRGGADELLVTNQQTVAALVRTIRHAIARARARVPQGAKERQVQRLEAIGQVATGVAHDLGNLLALAATALNRLASVQLDERGAGARDDLTLVFTQARGLVGAILAFAAPDRCTTSDVESPLGSTARVIDLNIVADEFVGFLRRVLPARLSLTVQRSTAPAWVNGDVVRIRQAIMNLVLNAHDALDGEGDVMVRVTSSEGTVGEAMHRIEVMDRGPGVSPEALPRLFDPFYSRRSRGGGTGLRLAIVKSVVESIEGRVEVAHRSGGGAVVTLLLPSAPPDSSPPGGSASPSGEVMPSSGVVTSIQYEAFRRRPTRDAMTREVSR
ncbi:MAG: ATP-binding protein [Phycisphaerae bacterium]|nr:ATP-binding protein [Phycisphaerae bacterium]